MPDIATTIRGCKLHCHKHQKVLYEHYRGFALKVVYRYIYSYEKALDIVNDGFVKLFNHVSNFQEGDNEVENEKKLMGWLKRIMINTAIDELRRKHMVQETGVIPEDVWDLSDHAYDADQQLLYKDLVIQVKKLPMAYRAVFNLYVIDGYSHAEIAGMLHMSEGNSKSSLSRARAMLKEHITKMDK